MKKATAYFKKHLVFTSTIHAIGGVGVGILITYPFIGAHPVRWGVALVAISILGHLYAWFAKS